MESHYPQVAEETLQVYDDEDDDAGDNADEAFKQTVEKICAFCLEIWDDE